MIFRRKSRAPEPGGSAGAPALAQAIEQHMPDADDDTRRLVVAVAGLFGCVAYADREYSEAERGHVREALGRIHGLDEAGVNAVCALLDDQITAIAASNTQAYTRDLRELGDLSMRREVLDALLDLAAADDDVSMAETDLLRRAATAMGLSQDDYVASQARHRERLSVLK